MSIYIYLKDCKKENLHSKLYDSSIWLYAKIHQFKHAYALKHIYSRTHTLKSKTFGNTLHLLKKKKLLKWDILLSKISVTKVYFLLFFFLSPGFSYYQNVPIWFRIFCKRNIIFSSINPTVDVLRLSKTMKISFRSKESWQKQYHLILQRHIVPFDLHIIGKESPYSKTTNYV